MHPRELEREARHRLPALLAELLGQEDAHAVHVDQPSADHRPDFVVRAGGHHWVVEVKSTSSPGVVTETARQLAAIDSCDATSLLVVPFMTQAGAKAAAGRRLNWIDLSGNASIRGENLYVSVQGRPNEFVGRGRPASAFAPKSSRVARTLLLDPSRWWRQKDLAQYTGLDRGRVSRIVRRLDDDQLLERDGDRLRSRDPDVLLDAWAEDYRFDHHDVITGHVSGSGMELARDLQEKLRGVDVDHAFTGMCAAWALGRFARFRLVSVYVSGDPRAAAAELGMRRNDRGANVQLVGPDDRGVFDGQSDVDGLTVVSPVQIYLDLGHMSERAPEAADHLRAEHRLWTTHG